MKQPKRTSSGKFRVWGIQNRVWIGYTVDQKLTETSVVLLKNSSGRIMEITGADLSPEYYE